jgi:PAS domain S-box-containing protein
MYSDSQTFYEEMLSSFPSAINSPDAFVAIDYDFQFLFLNRKAEKFYKRSKDDLIGKKVEEIFPEEWDFGPFRNLRISVEAKKSVEINYNSPFANAWVQLIGRPFENYYTFTYRMIDHKEVLKKELRKAVNNKK